MESVPALTMLAITRILCPVDFSDCSRDALEHAAAIARWYGATVTVLHVSAPPTPAPLLPDSDEPRPVAAASTSAHRRDGVSAQLSEFADPVKASGVPVTLEERPGTAVADILDRAQSLPADLIVIGTHGRSGVDRLVLGSVTEKVLRKAVCPVLTVPPPVRGPVSGPSAALPAPATSSAVLFRRILCAVDFSEPSMTALQYALSLAQEAEAQLLVLHVIEGIPDTAHWHHPDVTLLRYLRDTEEEALSRLRKAVPPATRTRSTVDELLSTGKPYREILRIAQERDVQLIVLGVHGRNPLDLMLFGSTTQHVVRTASCPVLTLRGR